MFSFKINIFQIALILCVNVQLIPYTSQIGGVPYHDIPPEHENEMFEETKHYEELFFLKRSYAEFIQGLMDRKQLNSSRIAKVFLRVRRSDFFNKKPKTGYGNIPYVFDHQVIMERPSYHALVLDLLVDHLKNGSRVLDIGSGQGYITTCMGHLVEPAGKVYGLEHVSIAVNDSIRNIKISSPELLERKNIEIIEKDARWGHPEGGPYDVIFYGAGTSEVSSTVLSQLKPHGRIVAPVGNVWRQNLSVIDKHADGTYTSKVIKKISTDFLMDLDFQMYPQMFSAPHNESLEGFYDLTPGPGERIRDMKNHPVNMVFSTVTHDSPYPEMYLDDSIDDRRIFPQKVLDLFYGVNKTKSLHKKK